MNNILGVVISEEDYKEFQKLKKKNTPMKKIIRRNKHCPICNYVLDNAVPKQSYCDNCGQRLIK